MAEQFQSNLISPERIPDILPVMPVYDVALFPKMVLPLVINHDNAAKLIDDAMSAERIVGMLLSKKPVPNVQMGSKDLYSVGTLAMILKMARGEDDKTQLMVQGLTRFKVLEYIDDDPYLQARIEMIEDKDNDDKESRALAANLLSQYQKIVKLSPGLPAEIGEMAKSIPEAGTLADMITSTINTGIEEKQKILEIQNVKTRLKEVTKLVNYQLEILEIGTKIQSQVKEDINSKQREYYLRQQIKAIQDELGETNENVNEIEEFRDKIEKSNMPDAAYKEADRELKRLARMHPSSSEYTVASTYLDWITALPWEESTVDNLDIKKARKVLDDDHFGLDKVKKRIIEYLAVRKLKPDSKGPILCFSGPPGTGKTSLGQSIARALGRKFIRIALGGMKDEAEIRGHRRTYVGALPGRIVQGLRRVGSNNPIIMLDEIDKVGNSFQGDPSSALLEVLDPEQNYSFSDHYLDVEFDLSKVMFITTANVLHTIPPALLDRLEGIELVGYTQEEKVKIANKYLVPRQRKAHGLKATHINMTDGAIKKVIQHYTREAGLRNLEREIANLCRGVASLIAQEEAESVNITQKEVPELLGPERYTLEVSSRISSPGVVMGLAWTPSGGEILYIEATSMAGNKGLTLTGQLGTVMKESVSTALSYIRSNATNFGIEESIFNNIDIHIHVPAGAIPKDGPSAGVTMLTALTSLLTNTLVRKNMAMTGEITLRGQVLPVGGIKEKVLAAHRAGIKNLIIPKQNEKDLYEISEKVRESINFTFAEKMVDVLNVAFEKRKDPERRKTRIKPSKERRKKKGDRREESESTAQ